MDIHPSNNLKECKIEHDDDNESKNIQIVNNFLSITYALDCSQYSRADIMDIHPSNDLYTYKMEHEDDSENEIIQL